MKSKHSYFTSITSVIILGAFMSAPTSALAMQRERDSGQPMPEEKNRLIQDGIRPKGDMAIQENCPQLSAQKAIVENLNRKIIEQEKNISKTLPNEKSGLPKGIVLDLDNKRYKIDVSSPPSTAASAKIKAWNEALNNRDRLKLELETEKKNLEEKRCVDPRPNEKPDDQNMMLKMNDMPGMARPGTPK